MQTLLIILPLLLGTAIAPPPQKTAKEIIEKVQSKYEEITDAVIQFSQSIRFKVSKLEQTTKGTLYFKKKNKYRIETENRVVVTDGKTSWAYNNQNNQVVIDTYKEESHTLSPEQLLLRYPTDFFSTLVGQEKVGEENTYVLKLTPKEESSFTKSLKLWISGKWTILKVEVTDINSAVTTYSVTSYILDKGIEDSRFQFQVPKGADVIDLR